MIMETLQKEGLWIEGSNKQLSIIKKKKKKSDVLLATSHNSNPEYCSHRALT